MKDVKFNYPNRKEVQILNEINVEIKPGDCVAFVGTSGSGKSTIVKLIERFYDTTQGSIFLNNQDIKNIQPMSIRKSIGLVS